METKEEVRRTAPKTLERIKEMKEKGVCPCDVCTRVVDPEKCSGLGCYPWYVWFKDKWRDIRKAARMKGYNV
jgi:hypothetical protein